jgi:hypothetical protein
MTVIFVKGAIEAEGSTADNEWAESSAFSREYHCYWIIFIATRMPSSRVLVQV